MINLLLNQLMAWLLAWLCTPSDLLAPWHNLCIGFLFVLWVIALTLADMSRKD